MKLTNKSTDKNLLNAVQETLELLDSMGLEVLDVWLTVQRRMLRLFSDEDSVQNERVIHKYSEAYLACEALIEGHEWSRDETLQRAGLSLAKLTIAQLCLLREEGLLDLALAEVEHSKSAFDSLAKCPEAEAYQTIYIAECAMLFHCLNLPEDAATLASLTINRAKYFNTKGGIENASAVVDDVQQASRKCLGILQEGWQQNRRDFSQDYLHALHVFIFAAGNDPAVDHARKFSTAEVVRVIRDLETEVYVENAHIVGQCCLAHAESLANSSSRSDLRAAAASIEQALKAFKCCKQNRPGLHDAMQEAKKLQIEVDTRRKHYRKISSATREQKKRRQLRQTLVLSGSLVFISLCLIIGLSFYAPGRSQCMRLAVDVDGEEQCTLFKGADGTISTPLTDGRSIRYPNVPLHDTSPYGSGIQRHPVIESCDENCAVVTP